MEDIELFLPLFPLPPSPPTLLLPSPPLSPPLPLRRSQISNRTHEYHYYRYKLDVAGFKKDIARRDTLLAEQAHALKAYPEEIEALRASHSRLLAEISRCRTEANGIVAERDKEIQRLEKVVGGLKHSISTNTRIEEAVGDEVFREMWSRIGWEVMNWCLANGAAKGGVINVESLKDDVRKELQTGIPEYEKLILGGHRVHVVQALLARLLIREIFSDWCFGITREQNSVLSALEKEFTKNSPQPAINTWRSSTSILLRTSLSTPPTTTLASKISTITSTILTAITPFFPIPPPQTSKTLPGIVEQTIRLSLHMQTQRAQFRIFPPLPPPPLPATQDEDGGERDMQAEAGEGLIWNSEDMEELSGEDESELEGTSVLVVAWPGMEKWGDEMGECCHVRNCVVRARVVCDVD
ncbi:hypothetical protein L873DRAFT_1663214 [Choiromyces venosus 120613-1]|uniref:Uncharacterized protein n=1 Tax=Choiromyces venosus 120613-1 TaxID=1336337 RepID=A0A3N4K4A2_9PEZI|nr:hypothetical protein L873DRAFT_1663214 [Choiromyces venosus 120613-1]